MILSTEENVSALLHTLNQNHICTENAIISPLPHKTYRITRKEQIEARFCADEKKKEKIRASTYLTK